MRTLHNSYYQTLAQPLEKQRLMAGDFQNDAGRKHTLSVVVK